MPHTYTVSVTFEYVGTAPIGDCTATAGSGLFNQVALPDGQETGADSEPNTACLTPPKNPITVTKLGACAPTGPACPLAGAEFALYTQDPNSPDATPGRAALTADTSGTVFTSLPLTVPCLSR